MRKKYILTLIFFVCVAANIVIGCSPELRQDFDIGAISSYRDIPGVTDEEIAAVEALKAAGRTFSYESLFSTEAFSLQDGTSAGFTAAFRELLSELFGIPFVQAFYEWEVLRKRIDGGLTDFTGDLTPTAERQKAFFMTEPIAHRSLSVFTYGTSPRVESEFDLNGLRIGFLSGAVTSEFVMRAYPMLRFDRVDIQNTSEVLELLRSGAIDAFIMDYVDKIAFREHPSIKASNVLPLVYTPVALTSTKAELAPVISVINKYIAAGGSKKLYELYMAGRYEYTRYVLSHSFTDEEKKFLEGAGAQVFIAVESDNYPVSFYNNREKEFQGIAVDVLTEISKLTGIEFRAANKKNTLWAELFALFRTGGASLITSLFITDERKEHFLWHDTPYFTSPYAFLSKSGHPSLEMYQIAQAAVGTIRGASYEDIYNMWFPDSRNLKRYDSNHEMLDALEKGEIELALASGYTLLYQINYREKPGYKINFVLPISTGSYFGFNKNEEVLRSIFNKTLNHVNVDKISSNWVNRAFDYSRAMAQTRTHYLTALVCVLLLGIIVLVVFTVNIAKNKNIIAKQATELKCREKMRDEMERAIAEANERTKLMLDSSPLCSEIWDCDFNIIDCNEATIKFFGVGSKEEYMKGIYNFSPEFQPDGQRSNEKTAAMITKALTAGRCVFDWQHVLLDGSLVPVEVTLAPVKYGNTTVVAVYTRDLREHVKMMNDIEQRDNLLRAVNHMANVLLTAQADETFEATLQSGMEIIGCCVNVDCIEIWQNEMINGKLHAVLKHLWLSEIGKKAKLDNTLVSFSYSDTPQWESRLLRGEYLHGPVSELPEEDRAFLTVFGAKSIFAVPLFIQNQLWGICCIDDYRAIRNFSEDEVNILRSGTLMMANAINRNAQSAEILKALELAEAGSKAKGDFLSTMSHEMRTPMNAIIGMTAIGKKAETLADKNHALNKIGDASSHLLGVINDVLDMAKIEANKLELAPIEYNFERMLQKVMNVVNYRVDEKSQALSINIDKNIPRFIVGDDQRLSQVITNLLSNAVKFTPEGGNIRFEASLASIIGDTCELRIEISDDGIGIPLDKQEKLFVAFEQAESGTSREYGGTGLGLVIAKRIIELMDGSIWVESESGKGTKFIFTLKAYLGEKNPRSLLASDVNWETVRILAVDDILEVREQFQDIFSHLNITCDVAEDGIEACRIIEERGGYDIYFIDWRMPRMDGIELTKKIKSNERNRPSVVIMITAMDWEQIKEEAYRVGVDKHLLKPLFSSSVIDCVNECLGTAKNRGKDIEDAHGEFAGKRMLLAEDIEINREIVMALLENTGFAIDCAENGQEALDMVAAAPNAYDIIFMDVQMPKMDGHEATRRIRALPALQGVKLPIIAMTANVFKSDIEACIASGMDEHLGKPVDIDKVLEVLRKYMNKR